MVVGLDDRFKRNAHKRFALIGSEAL